jgi:hypothetical protein
LSRGANSKRQFILIPYDAQLNAMVSIFYLERIHSRSEYGLKSARPPESLRNIAVPGIASNM